MKPLKTLLSRLSPNPKNDILSGLTVALALVPEAVAFAFIAGVDPLVGLYGAFMMGLVTAIFGGRPGMISGATGAMAVVMVHMIQQGNSVGSELTSPIENLGLYWLFITLLFVGILQISAGVFKLGKFVRLIPHPVMMGFVNGLAIVIFLSQLALFKSTSNGITTWLSGEALYIMLALVALTMAIMYFLPKLTKKIPSALTAIIIVACITIFGGIEVSTVGSFIRDGGGNSLQGGLPQFQFELFRLFNTLNGHWDLILSTAFLLAAVGLIESLMTLNLIDEITETQGSSNRECLGQGAANLLCGFFGGMGGCAMIGQSLINVESGGRGRLSGAFAACSLLTFILFFSSWIEMIPMAALVGVMFMVVIGTFEWASLKLYRKVPTTDFLVMCIVTLYTAIMHDLASAVIIGVIVSSLAFAFKHAKHVNAETRHNERGDKIYQLHGPLFFASTTQFKEIFDPKNDPDCVIIDFYFTKVYDHSALEAIHSVAQRYSQVGKTLHLTHLSHECREMLQNAQELISFQISDEPQHHVSTDRFTSVESTAV